MECRRLFGSFVLAILAAGLSLATGAAQDTPLTDADRQHVMEIYEQNKFVEALPLLERLAAERPKDMVVKERFGFAVLVASAGLRDPEARRRERLRARKILLEAKVLGDNSNLLQILLQGIPEDGGNTTPFSGNKEVDGIMRDAEAAFGRGDMQEALDGYVRAFALDPNLYEAALFAGDVYFKTHRLANAGEWYARAIRINPDSEMAYRYWGDALMAAGDMQQARSKFIEAIVAEPYRRNVWIGAQQWAERNKLSLSFPKIKPPHSVSAPSTGTDGKTHIDVNMNGALLEDKAKDGMSAWFIYPLHRATWPTQRFAKEFPGEKQYRHSLKEEAESLHLVAEDVRDQLRKKKVKSLDPDLALLVKLDDEGLLEAFVLIAMADQGISQDYAAYRAANRDKLRQYLDAYAVPKLP
jgi:tetratricopeptide (TPR) repeat protein